MYLSIAGGGWDAGAGVLEEGGVGGRGDRNFFFLVYIAFRFGGGVGGGCQSSKSVTCFVTWCFP